MWSAAVLEPAFPGRSIAGQGFVGVVQPGQQRVIAEAVLEGRPPPAPSPSGRSPGWRPGRSPDRAPRSRRRSASGSAGPPPRAAARPVPAPAPGPVSTRPARPPRSRPAPATPSRSRRPARTGRVGDAAPPDPRWPHRRRPAAPRDRSAPDPARAPNSASGVRPPPRRTPAGLGRVASLSVHGTIRTPSAAAVSAYAAWWHRRSRSPGARDIVFRQVCLHSAGRVGSCWRRTKSCRRSKPPRRRTRVLLRAQVRSTRSHFAVSAQWRRSGTRIPTFRRDGPVAVSRASEPSSASAGVPTVSRFGSVRPDRWPAVG